MDLMRLSLLLCLAAQALTRPMERHQDQDDSASDQDPFIFQVIETANEGSPVVLKEMDIFVDTYRNGRICRTCTWPKNSNGTVQVPYTIVPRSYSPSDISLINQALSEFGVMTCVQFVNRTTESDYLNIVSQSGSGCWSYIGRIFGKQTLSLESSSCMTYGVIQHEAMHNIGFFHEHTRVDRDNYIDIKWDNIDQGYWGDFNINQANTLNLPYDYTSVMHYYRYAYAETSTLPSIVPKPDPTVPIGQRLGLSSLDVISCVRSSLTLSIYVTKNKDLCRTKLVTASGSLSGNSSSANQSGGNCLWLIQVPSKKVSLNVTSLNISSTDYIKVYDGMLKTSPVLLGMTNGSGPISTLVSSGCNMLVEFVSMASSKFSNFNATYSTAAGVILSRRQHRLGDDPQLVHSPPRPLMRDDAIALAVERNLGPN
ncbi:hatching enzyme 1.2-like [Bufo gargarizans]|uniref:hatching enzyme 1.2-like n=1 Tax=Bufo gargarizans TaxID=30331 RepID=UPI001CF3CDFD|nr:hatching enzyme 1.2-like [Bufo gargarizans]